MYKIDNIDSEIVNMLMEDGRMRAAVIARRLGNKSERAVRYRIDRMIENNVIRLSAIVNPKGLGMNVVADVLLEVESDSILNVAKKMTEYENVSYVACSIVPLVLKDVFQWRIPASMINEKLNDE
jgi:Lrp/AsnC family transcriptional regulator, regulator for asnA, asnC and gidA